MATSTPSRKRKTVWTSTPVKKRSMPSFDTSPLLPSHSGFLSSSTQTPTRRLGNCYDQIDSSAWTPSDVGTPVRKPGDESSAWTPSEAGTPAKKPLEESSAWTPSEAGTPGFKKPGEESSAWTPSEAGTPAEFPGDESDVWTPTEASTSLQKPGDSQMVSEDDIPRETPPEEHTGKPYCDDTYTKIIICSH